MKSRQGKEQKHLLCRFIEYSRRHVMIPLYLSFGALVLLAGIIFQGYLQEQFYSFLISETTRSDERTLELENYYITGALKAFVETGTRFSLDSLLASHVQDYLEDGTSVDTGNALRTDLRLKAQTDNNIIALAAVDSDNHILNQYNRNNGWTGIDPFWTESNHKALSTLCNNLRRIIRENRFPAYAFSVDPEHFTSTPVAIASQNPKNLLHLAYRIPLSGSHEGVVLVLSCHMDSIQSFLGKEISGGRDYTTSYITDQDGKILYCGSQKLVGKDFEEYIGSRRYKSRVLSTSINNPKWSLHIVLNVNKMKQYVLHLYLSGLAILILLLLVIVSTNLFLVRRTFRPVQSIAEAMENISAGRLDYKIPIGGENEIWQLAVRYNEMAASLAAQQKQLQEENREKLASARKASEAEMAALQSQINAHFLSNTLNAIHYSAISGEREEVIQMIMRLSKAMQYVYSRTYNAVTIGDEIDWVEQYLALQRFRLMDVFEYEIEFPELYREWPCCKLFLQPFLENSIVHGFAEREKGGLIRVVGKNAGSRLSIEISDNGSGLDPETESMIQQIITEQMTLVQGGRRTHQLELKGAGIGLQNVIIRLRMFYGKGFAIRLWSRPGRGCTFHILLPIPEQMESEEP